MRLQRCGDLHTETEARAAGHSALGDAIQEGEQWTASLVGGVLPVMLALDNRLMT